MISLIITCIVHCFTFAACLLLSLFLALLLLLCIGFSCAWLFLAFSTIFFDILQRVYFILLYIYIFSYKWFIVHCFLCCVFISCLIAIIIFAIVHCCCFFFLFSAA